MPPHMRPQRLRISQDEFQVFDGDERLGTVRKLGNAWMAFDLSGTHVGGKFFASSIAAASFLKESV